MNTFMSYYDWLVARMPWWSYILRSAERGFVIGNKYALVAVARPKSYRTTQK